jgi:hypothetical protein
VVQAPGLQRHHGQHTWSPGAPAWTRTASGSLSATGAVAEAVPLLPPRDRSANYRGGRGARPVPEEATGIRRTATADAAVAPDNCVCAKRVQAGAPGLQGGVRGVRKPLQRDARAPRPLRGIGHPLPLGQPLHAADIAVGGAARAIRCEASAGEVGPLRLSVLRQRLWADLGQLACATCPRAAPPPGARRGFIVPRDLGKGKPYNGAAGYKPPPYNATTANIPGLQGGVRGLRKPLERDG